MTDVLPTGVRARLRSSADPAARWVALTGLDGLTTDDSTVGRTRDEVLADPGTRDLLGRLHPWDEWHPVGGHDKPEYLPNLLSLLAGRGVGADEDQRIADIHRSMLDHQADDGRFQYLGRRKDGELVWSSLPCDHHAITEVLLRAGWYGDPRVERALSVLAERIALTAQGPAWHCVPDPLVGFRGPGRVADACPQVTVEALRVFSLVPESARPEGLDAVVHTTLGFWRNRGEQRPYMFGHGRQFKRGKWPATWYSAFSVVDAVGRYPQAWAGPDADPDDRRALAELAACVLAYGFDADGAVVPRSVYRGFETHSFGQRKLPSDLAAAQLAVTLARLEPLSEDILGIDPTLLTSSVGGAGTALAP